MKYKELSNSNLKQLSDQSNEMRAELFQLKLKHKTAQLDKKSKLKMVRRDIARIETKISELSNGKAK